MHPLIKERCEALSRNFKEIKEERKSQLNELVSFIKKQLQENQRVNLLFVCTHNSRRSHLAQVWAKTAAHYYGWELNSFSAGTEATAMNGNAISALERAGFTIAKTGGGSNPHYKIYFGEGLYCDCFSKTIDDVSLPKDQFITIMTCGDADAHCPYIAGTALRAAITYNDPKAYDGTGLQDEKYTERSNQIAMECLYLFSKTKDVTT